MARLILEASHKTPEVDFNDVTGILVMKGTSVPEHSREYYEPINEWLLKYGENPQANTKLQLQMDYFNTSSSACLLQIFEILAKIQEAGKSQVEVYWYYEDTDPNIQEAGEFFSEIVKIPFQLVEIKEAD